VRGEPPRHPRRQVPNRLRGRLGPLHADAHRLGAVPECHNHHPPLGTRVPPPPRPRVDAEGFQMVLSRASRRHASRAAAKPLSAPAATLQGSRIPKELSGRCLNCLSCSQRVLLHSADVTDWEGAEVDGFCLSSRSPGQRPPPAAAGAGDEAWQRSFGARESWWSKEDATSHKGCTIACAGCRQWLQWR